MKIATYFGGLVGLGLLIALAVRTDLHALLHAVSSAGAALAWLLPYRALFYLLYALGWLMLLYPYDPKRRAGLGYLWWVTAVRDAVDRLLPVASVGGSVVGTRLVTWRGIPAAGVAASVVVEIVLTLIVSYLFTALGLLLLFAVGRSGDHYHRLLYGFLLSLPIPVATVWVLRHGAVFGRLQKLLRPLIGEYALAQGAASLDRELRASLQRGLSLSVAGTLQLAALISGAFEVWFALRLFGHPVTGTTALILESLILAARHLAFVVPAGIGVQEAGFVVFGQALGISGELALAVSMVKRLRELLWGVPALLSWQWLEGWRLHKALRTEAS